MSQFSITMLRHREFLTQEKKALLTLSGVEYHTQCGRKKVAKFLLGPWSWHMSFCLSCLVIKFPLMYAVNIFRRESRSFFQMKCSDDFEKTYVFRIRFALRILDVTFSSCEGGYDLDEVVQCSVFQNIWGMRAVGDEFKGQLATKAYDEFRSRTFNLAVFNIGEDFLKRLQNLFVGP